MKFFKGLTHLVVFIFTYFSENIKKKLTEFPVTLCLCFIQFSDNVEVAYLRTLTKNDLFKFYKVSF